MRTEKAILNMSVSLSTKLLTLVLNFISRIVFVNILSSEYLGINGLFSNILSILSMAELGVGPALLYCMYKPIAEKDYEKIKALMQLYKKIYIYIGLIIGAIGLTLTPFLKYLIKDMPDIKNLIFIYILYLMNTVSTYFYIYKRSILEVNQMVYVTKMYQNAVMILQQTGQMIILIFTHDFILYLFMQLFCTFLNNYLISKKADSLYPYIKDKNKSKVDKETLNKILNNMKAMFAHKLGGVVVSNTSNLLMSAFVGIVTVGLYSNYTLVINSLNELIRQTFTAVTPSVGNLGAVENSDKQVEIYHVLNFMVFLIYSTISIGMFVLFNDFIELWVGENYLLPISVVSLIILNFYINGMRRATLIFKDALGAFWYDRYKPIFESIINLVVSIILVKKIGVVGIFVGTTISTLTTSFWVEPYVLYKHCFKISIWDYFLKYIIYTISTIGVGGVCYFICRIMPISGILGFILRGMIIVIICISLISFLFHKTNEFKYIMKILIRYIEKMKSNQMKKLRVNER